jgi:Transposase
LKFVLAHKKDQSMKRSSFSEEQIIGILKEHEVGLSVADLCRKHGVSGASIYKWKAKFGGMEVSEAKRLYVPWGEWLQPTAFRKTSGTSSSSEHRSSGM